jgi:hypothetical protein
MATPRRAIALVSDATQWQQLQEIARSRTEPASRVERARIILGYLALLAFRLAAPATLVDLPKIADLDRSSDWRSRDYPRCQGLLARC